MNEFDGFKPCEEIKAAPKMGKWNAALKEFMDSGMGIACKEYDSKEDARKAASGFHGRKDEYNWRYEYRPRLKEANKKPCITTKKQLRSCVCGIT